MDNNKSHPSAEHIDKINPLQFVIMEEMAKELYGRADNEALYKWIEKYSPKFREIADRQEVENPNIWKEIEDPDKKRELIDKIKRELTEFREDLKKAA